jgi:AAA15 family ATPase/GTPase
MLKRLYVDNFRCLVDVELNFDSINLFLGDNGAGKSTIFDVLSKLQSLTTTDINVRTIFKLSDYTRWQNQSFYSLDQNPDQVFELEFLGNGGIYKYELKINFQKVLGIGNDIAFNNDTAIGNDTFTIKRTIENERLSFNEKLLLNIDEQEVSIFSDDRVEHRSSRYNFYQSIIPLLQPNELNKNIIWFRERMKRLMILKITPDSITSESSQKNSFLTKKMENFVSWYRYIFADNQNKLAQLTESLQDILDGFICFKLERISEKAVILKLIFKTEESDQTIEYTFGELSDGQKVLVVLYSLFYGLESQDYTLCIDEPENFLALPEIQPWLFQLYDLCSENKLQALLISHHPELIDYLLASPVGYWFKRESNSPVQVTPIDNNFLQPVINNIQQDNKSGLKMSELIARGWLDE